MNDLIPALISGVVFAMGGMMFFALLVGIGYLLEWWEKK